MIFESGRHIAYHSVTANLRQPLDSSFPVHRYCVHRIVRVLNLENEAGFFRRLQRTLLSSSPTCWCHRSVGADNRGW